MIGRILDCLSPLAVEVHGYHSMVPCGTCPSCLRRRSSHWDLRCRKDRAYYKKKADIESVRKRLKLCNVYEDKQLTDELIIDLTYNNKFLPADQSLNREDLQKFIKRFRENVRSRYGHTGVRVLYSGEYGETGTHRPHYHLLFWNLPHAWVSEWRRLIEFCWSDFDRSVGTRESKGYIYCEVPRDFHSSASYVSKSVSYVVKGGLHKFCRQPKEKLEDFQRRTGRRTLPFVGASLGLGLDYLIEDCDCMSIMKQGYMQDGAYKVSIPRYYANKMKDIYRHVFFFNSVSREIVNSEVPEVFTFEEISDIAAWKFASYDCSKQRLYLKNALKKYGLDVEDVLNDDYTIDVSQVDTFVDLMPKVKEYNMSMSACGALFFGDSVTKYQKWRRCVFEHQDSEYLSITQRARNRWDSFVLSVEKGLVKKEKRICQSFLNS